VTPRSALRLLAALAAAATVSAAVEAGPDPVGASAARAPRDGVAVPATFVLTGGGWGHGVGMSQYGAQAQALAGRTVQQILQHYYTGTALSAVGDDDDIRVRVLGGARSADVTVRALDELGGRFVVTSGSSVLRGRAGDKLALRVTPDGVRATLTHAGTATSLEGALVRIRWQGTRALAGGPTAVLVDGAGGIYRWGRLEARRLGGALTVVNVLRLHDEYLNGIAEVPTSWAPAALQAQAVAARTYAVKALAHGVLGSCACHVYDDTRSQVFAGWEREGAPGGSRWRAAVRATAPTRTTGTVVTYAGRPIDAVYFSSDGGATENSEDVWSSAVPYLRSVPDPWSAGGGNPLAVWSRTRTQAQVAAAFGLPDVVTLDLTDRTDGGSVRRAVATSSTGRRVAVSGGQLASRLGLPARWLARPARRVVPSTAVAGWGTSLAGARTAASATSATAVVAGSGTSGVTAEAAVAATLARHLRVPLVLVPPTGVPTAVRTFLSSRHVDHVVVVGGTDTVPDAVATSLGASSVTVTRVAGADRYATAALVAAQVGAPDKLAVTAPGEDASLAATVAAAATAAATGRPLLLVRAGDVPSATAAAYTSLQIKGGLCAGTTAQLSAPVLTAVPACVRVSGTDEAGTAAALLRAVGRAADAGVLGVTATTPAGLAGGVTAAALGLPLVYAGRTAPSASVALLQATPGVRLLQVFAPPTVLTSGALLRLRRS
jgi:SpoIID/LytB domain protein